MLSAADQAIFAAIEAHRAALDALDQCVATLGDIGGGELVFDELERRERMALSALIALTPQTAAGYRAVAAHLVLCEMWNEGEMMFEPPWRAFAGEPA